MAKPDFIPKPEWNANILALSNGIENYINESLQKLLETWRQTRSQFLYSASRAPALPSRDVPSQHQLSVGRSLKTVIGRDLPCACKVPNLTPK